MFHDIAYCFDLLNFNPIKVSARIVLFSTYICDLEDLLVFYLHKIVDTFHLPEFEKSHEKESDVLFLSDEWNRHMALYEWVVEIGAGGGGGGEAATFTDGVISQPTISYLRLQNCFRQWLTSEEKNGCQEAEEITYNMNLSFYMIEMLQRTPSSCYIHNTPAAKPQMNM